MTKIITFLLLIIVFLCLFNTNSLALDNNSYENGNEDYMIPFSHSNMKYDIENYKVYEVNDFINIVKNQHLNQASSGNRGKTNISLSNLSYVIGFLVICLTYSVSVYNYKKDKRQIAHLK